MLWAEIFLNKFFLSDEAHFTIGEYVNKKESCCICSSENPQVIEESQLHPEKVNVWCVLWSEGLIGSYSFENEDSER